jgi:DNA polymerase III alpha subunit
LPDIDLDFANRQLALDKLTHITASRAENGDFKKHNTGVYCHVIPYNPLTGLSAIEYKKAEDRGYFKIDFLNVSAYQGIKNEEQLEQLLKIEPLWDLLEDSAVCDQMFHINGYHNMIAKLKPRSIEQLAMFLALLRPGKKHLIPVCNEKGFDAIENEIWVKTEDAYFFKKAHAVAYAHVIVVQLNLLCENISYGFS